MKNETPPPADNGVEDLQAMLFTQMRNLSDPEKNLDVEMKRASAMADVAKVIVESGKLQVAAIRATGKPTSKNPKLLSNGK